MWIWLVELSYIPLYEELEPETSLQRDRFPCRLTKFHKCSSRRRRFVGSYEQKELSQNLAVLYGYFQQASICRTLNYCVSGQATLRFIVSTVVYDCSAKRIFLYFGKSAEQCVLGFRECSHVFVAMSKLFLDLFSCTIHCFDEAPKEPLKR